MIPPVVDLAWVTRRPAVVWIDARAYLDGGAARGRVAYRAGHVPGARFFDRDVCGAAPPSAAKGRHPLPSPETFADCCSQLGIAPPATVVAYDDTGGAAAARVVWLLRAVGVDAALLDGGIAAWEGPLETGEPAPVPPARFPPRPWPPELIADADDTAAATLVVDARAPERYRGEVEPIDAKAGHIPGARNVPFEGNLDAAGRWLPAGALRARYEAAGVTDDRDAVVYCGSGVTACHDLLAIERAGLGRKRLYPGSWSQWSSDPTREVETGD